MAEDPRRASSGRKRGKKRGGGRRNGGPPPRTETSAGGVVFRRAETGVVIVLLIRDPYQNWGLPKGHVEAGETPLQTAIREVREETGLEDLETRDELPGIDWYFRDNGHLVHKYCRFFLMESRSGDTCPQVEEGITDCIWLPVAEALETITYDNARQVLKAASDRLAAMGGP